MKITSRTRRLRQTRKLKGEIAGLQLINKQLRSQISDMNSADFISLLRIHKSLSASVDAGKKPLAIVLSPEVHSELRKLSDYARCVEYGEPQFIVRKIFGCGVVVDSTITGWYLQNEKYNEN